MLLGVDVGGTFTDAVLLRDGSVHTAKVPTTADQAVGVLQAVEAVLRQGHADAGEVGRFAHGMTVATNALLEGNVARTALLVTEGFADIIELGRQARPHLYRLCQAPPPPLVPPELRFEVPERMTPDGPLKPLAQRRAQELVRKVGDARPEAIAVVLLHSDLHPDHEQMLGSLIAGELPGVHLSLSHDLVGTFREYERAATTEIDAALSPKLSGYLRHLAAGALGIGLPAPEVMQSSGGLLDAGRAAEHAALTVLSGPAGGVGGALLLAEAAGEKDLLCVDMGGTSCDVCLISDGVVSETRGRSIAGRPLALPALDIHTVGAGGGSIAWGDAGGALRVGPSSAGACPGPACYGRGGTAPTVTDANLLLGRLPADVPLAGGVSLDAGAAKSAIGSLADQLGLELLACAEGVVRVAESEMLAALRVVSVERGVDPRKLTLLAFGGAGPLHAAALADSLSITRIMCPRASGVLSALGLAAAAPRRDASQTVMLSGENLSAAALHSASTALAVRVLSQLQGGGGPGGPALEMTAEMRYLGQSFELAVRAPMGTPPERLRTLFEQEHLQRYGYLEEGAVLELVTLRVSARGVRPHLDLAVLGHQGQSPDPNVPRSHQPEHFHQLPRHQPPRHQPPPRQPPPPHPTEVVFSGHKLQAALLVGELAPNTPIAGPAVCALGESTLWVPPGWEGRVDERGTAIIDRAVPR